MVDKWTIPKSVGLWMIRHPIESFIVYKALQMPATRGLMLDHLAIAGRGLFHGTRQSWASMSARIISPAARAAVAGVTGPTAQTAAIVAAPVVVAAVGAAGVTAAYQKVDLIGPNAPRVESAYPSTKKAPFNPFFMGWGSVV